MFIFCMKLNSLIIIVEKLSLQDIEFLYNIDENMPIISSSLFVKYIIIQKMKVSSKPLYYFQAGGVLWERPKVSRDNLLSVVSKNNESKTIKL